MMVARIERHASQWSAYLAVAAISSLVTSWALETPMLHRKEAKLQIVEQKVLPAMAVQVARAKTGERQARCDALVYEDVAQLAVAAEKNHNLPAPDLDDITGCPKVKPISPVIPRIPAPETKS